MKNKAKRQTAVLKVGGSQLIEDDDLESLGQHVLELSERGDRVLIVHGGGPEIGELHRALGLETKMKSGIRATPDESMPVATMVLCGLVNKRLVSHLVSAGIRALGLSGLDLGLMRSSLLNPIELGRVGGPPRVDVTTLESLLDVDIVPVISPISTGTDGRAVNVNADTVAQAVASALRAETLDFISGVRGVHGDNGWVRTIEKREVPPLIARSVVRGGMIPKLHAAIAAIEAGVGRVRMGNLLSLEQGTATVVTA